jgi:hypothetical protein
VLGLVIAWLIAVAVLAANGGLDTAGGYEDRGAVSSPVLMPVSAPYGGCAEAWQAPRSEGARWCRSHGWLVGARYVVSPRKVLRFYHLPPCRYEDGSGQPLRGGNRNCGWNVTEGDGNGRGLVYLVLGMGANRHYVDLRICTPDCHPWRR